jgi:glycosyltransferase involved in cell wall biosynthesis
MPSDPVILTIAIPTYNRAAKLRAQLERLVPQLGPQVRVCVYDNDSPDETREVVAPYLDRGISYFRAIANCGAGRNFFRCFEECQTEWLWILSDDDLATQTVVADLLAVLSRESADFVHTYSWQCPYTQDRLVSDIPSLLEHSKLSSLLWVTAGIYRLRSFRPFFRLFNDGMSTWGPHLIMVLSLLAARNGRVHLTPLRLTIPTTGPIPWSTLDCLLRLSHLPEHLADPDHQRLVAERIFLEFFNDFMLIGLRETAGKPQVCKWRRIYFQSRRNLQAYQARGVGSFVFRNWYRSGLRKQSLHLATQAVTIKLLSWCPVAGFHVLIRILPLSKDMRTNYYNQRKESVVYA